jgi:two-component sensor histidine kinase
MSLWERYLNIGSEAVNNDKLNKISLTNKLLLFVILINTLSSISNFILGDFDSLKFSYIGILIYLISVILQIYGYRQFVSFLLIANSTTLVFYFNIHHGFESGAYLFMFPIILILGLIYDFETEKKIIAVHLIYASTLILIYNLVDLEFLKNKMLQEKDRQIMLSFNLILCLLCLLTFVFLTLKIGMREKHNYKLLLEQNKKTEQITAQALNVKNTLIAELHHRVKNNLAIISSLFNLKINDDLHEDAKNVLIESRNRVRSMALIHNQLYKDVSLTTLNFSSFATSLIEEINSSYPEVSDIIVLTTNFQDAIVAIDNAIPCGLILNELLTNCYKHAFKGRNEGTIKVSFEKEADFLNLIVCDNGVGLPEKYNEKSSLGMTVIEALAEQLEAKFEFTKHTGTCFKMSFKA